MQQFSYFQNAQHPSATSHIENTKIHLPTDVDPRCNAKDRQFFFFLSRKLPNFEIKVMFMFSFKIWGEKWGSHSKYLRKKLSNLTWVVYGKGAKICLENFQLLKLRFCLICSSKFRKQ